jgi:hypothetical protein
MDALSLYWNAVWQDAQRLPRRLNAGNSDGERAAFARMRMRLPSLFYSSGAKRWFALPRTVSDDPGPAAPRREREAA